MSFALVVYLLHRTYPHVLNTYLSGFNTLWGQLLSVTTFTLTFFVNQSYALWRKCMELSRRLQGRLHDVNMNMASHAERVVPANPNEKSTYTAASRQILELMSRYVRLFNLLTYASFTRSHRPILTPRGLRRLVERGLMTAQERDVLVDAVIPATQRHSVVLMWMIRLFVEGRASGHIQGGHGFESETMHKFHIIRSQYGAIGDELQGRMPLAYAHIVQVLVDFILWMFPIMAFSSGMSPVLVIVGTGLLTMSYQGLFDLAKQFLDPYDNENYGKGDDPLCVDTLIAETNAGSIRWLYGFEELPYSVQRLNDGELYEYLLPVRGYSVEELDEMERERIERERQLEEQRKREDEEAAAAEVERLRKEAEEKEKEAERENDEEAETEATQEEELLETVMSMENTTTAELTETSEEVFAEFLSSEDDELIAEFLSAEDESTVESTEIVDNTTVSEVEEEIVPSTIEANGNATKTDIAEESDDIDDATEIRPVHTVTTLATDGSPISSFNPSQPFKSVREEPVPSGMQTANYLATLRMQNERIKSLLESANFRENILEEQEDDLIDFEAFEDLPWFDEVGSDGQEFRLSQQLADEEWVEEDTDDIQVRTMTKEEYEARVKEIEENAENELQETIDIMSAIPGDESVESDGTLYTVTERRKRNAPVYDQTRLDGISQLWGLPPEDPAALSEYEPPEKVDDVDFGSISQLWGGSELSDSLSTTSTQSTRQDDSDVVGMGSFAGISELWGPNREIDPGLVNETLSDSAVNGNGDVDGDGNADEYVGSSFMGLPWHNEKGPDGQEYRLSQMLADEEWVSDYDVDEVQPMTLEDYNEQVQQITEKLEEELRETEAILLSKPGTDPVGWDYDDEQLAPMSNVTNSEESEEEEGVGSQNKTIIEDADLAVLEMDVELEEEEEANGVEGKSDDNITIAEADDNDNGDGDDSVPTMADTTDAEADQLLGDDEDPDVVSSSNEIDDSDITAVVTLEDESLEEIDDVESDISIEGEVSAEDESSESDEGEDNDAKNIIEPIFLEDQPQPEESPTVGDDGEEEDDVRL
jgi:hypothetical protein